MTQASKAPVLVSEHQGGVLTLTLNRPERKNALTFELVEELGTALGALPSRGDVQVVVLRGAGGAFCSGADLNTIVEAPGQDVGARIDEFHRMIMGIFDAPQPVIAVVEGPAVGFGADLAMACDARIFSESAYLEEGFIKVGLMPDGGGTHFLPRFLGARAFEYLAFGTRLSAHDCERFGIANSVVPPQELAQTIHFWTVRLCAAAPLALRHIKRATRATERGALLDALQNERTGQSELIQSDDFKEGVAAFLAKRTPQFTGK